jgi:hypothetical protein
VQHLHVHGLHRRLGRAPSRGDIELANHGSDDEPRLDQCEAKKRVRTALHLPEEDPRHRWTATHFCPGQLLSPCENGWNASWRRQRGVTWGPQNLTPTFCSAVISLNHLSGRNSER